MKILFLTYRPPYPPIAGEKLRVYQQIQLLSEQNELILLTFISSEEENIQSQLLAKETGIQVYTVPIDRKKAKIRALLSIFKSLPMQVAYYDSPEMLERSTTIVKEKSIDLVYVQLARMASYFVPSVDCPQVIDFMDAFSAYYQTRSLIERNPIMKYLDSLESKRMKQWEQSILKLYDASSIISTYDANLISTENPPTVIPNHVDDFLNYQGIVKNLGDRSLIFFGEMGTYYSESAVSYCTKEIMPKVWSIFPDVKLYIVGANPTKKIQQLQDRQIIVTGYVPDIREYVAGAKISISPLMMGSGLKNKIVQSMAMGIPVVASSQANQGVDGKHGEDILIADNSTDFANAINLLLEDNILREKIVQNAYDLIDRNFTSQAIFSKLDRFLQIAISRKKIL